MNPMLFTALVLGVAGSAHCIGMCGPIALAVPSPGPGVGVRLRSTLLLNGGRLMTYVLLGMAIGTFGHGLHLAGLQQVVSIVAGVLLLLSVLVPGLLQRFSPTGRLSMDISRLRSALARNLKRTAPEALFLTGVLNGLLPCGLLYAALLGIHLRHRHGRRALHAVLRTGHMACVDRSAYGRRYDRCQRPGVAAQGIAGAGIRGGGAHDPTRAGVGDPIRKPWPGDDACGGDGLPLIFVPCT